MKFPKEGLKNRGLFGKFTTNLLGTIFYWESGGVIFLMIDLECWTDDLSLANLNCSLGVNFCWLTIPLVCLSIEGFIILEFIPTSD